MTTMLKPLPWHEDLWLEVTALVLQNQLSHALLLAGPRGVGKRAFARALSAFLLCEARSGYACGQCRGCQQFLAGTHPNYFLLQPEKDEKTGKERRDIAIEQVRVLSERLSLSGHYGQARVAVFDPADALNMNGVNALLKTIEEPPPNTHLLLISERVMVLPATLRSRCQRLRLAPPPADQALEWLRTEHGLSDAAMLEQAHGAPLRVVQMKESGLLDVYQEWARGMTELAAQKRDPLSAAGMVSKEQVPQFLEWLQQWLTGLLKQKLTASGGVLAQNLSASAVGQMLQEVLEGQRKLTGNASPQMLLESLLILWWRLTRGIKVA